MNKTIQKVLVWLRLLPKEYKVQMSLDDVNDGKIKDHCQNNNVSFTHLILNEDKQSYTITFVR